MAKYISKIIESSKTLDKPKIFTMSYILVTYSCYLVITIMLTIWVARALFRNGKIFLIDIFHGNTALDEKRFRTMHFTATANPETGTK
jgi:hypothetical protein